MTAVSHEAKSNRNSEVEVNSWASRAALDIIGVAGSKAFFPSTLYCQVPMPTYQ